MNLCAHFFEEGTYEELQATLASSVPSPTSFYLDTLIKGEVSAGVGGGQVAGMINDIPSCQQLIQRMVHEAEPILERLNLLHN